ncbi:hypothetical protein PV04_04692 [Phialophora macrospora]|uniref:Uncharacterized protein n=1 Tax=Phialophora macrospora TaxID=1851006 RepID=A0A0D2FQC2_9EURO|nr:hypothetical protein PV04_04692 [Phialophora macrospora]
MRVRDGIFAALFGYVSFFGRIQSAGKNQRIGIAPDNAITTENDIIDPGIMDEYYYLPPGYEPYGPTPSVIPSSKQLASMDSAQVDPEYEKLYNSFTTSCEPSAPTPSAMESQDKFTSIDSTQPDPQCEESHCDIPPTCELYGPAPPVIHDPLTPVDSVLLDPKDQGVYNDILPGCEPYGPTPPATQDLLSPVDSALFDPEDQDVNSGDALGIETIRTPLPEVVVQDPLPPVSNTALDPALLVDDAALEAHHSQLAELAANLEYAREVVGRHEAKVKAQLEKLWDDNADFRRRGLRGGKARKNRKDHGAYVRFEETAALGAEFHKHRLDVEKLDYEGRNRQAGLAALSEMFEETHDWILQQREICEDMIRCTNLAKNEILSPMVLNNVSNMSAIVFGEPEENRAAKLADIKAMVAAFFEEYDQNLI